MTPIQQVVALRMRCPRCPAIGYAVPSERGPYLEVLWTDGVELWVDGAVFPEEIQRGTYGCGFDPEEVGLDS